MTNHARFIPTTYVLGQLLLYAGWVYTDVPLCTLYVHKKLPIEETPSRFIWTTMFSNCTLRRETEFQSVCRHTSLALLNQGMPSDRSNSAYMQIATVEYALQATLRQNKSSNFL
ncbi:unnamed protein product [Nezara viridula]|uniref:Uncharacterized protein n=1 Tax=Nezara viridula TaxID=85310 RepID=A0A9P0HTB4_NEZVI|nr:unnamed protein product [Nezara viridula]